MSEFNWTECLDTRTLIQSYMKSDFYPIESIWNLFSCFNCVGANREFAFFRLLLNNSTEREYVSRRNSYKNLEQFKGAIITNTPFRIDIGPIRISPPTKNQELSYIVTSELRIDIDINEYDGDNIKWTTRSRSCCQGRDFCPACWPLVTIAARQLNITMKALGSTNHGWFYTGGRGIHCWNFTRTDPIFMDPDKNMRRRLINYLCGQFEQDDIVDRAAGPLHNPLCLNLIQSLLLDNVHSFLIWYLARHPYIALTTISKCASNMIIDARSDIERSDISRVIFSENVINAADEIQNVRLSKLRSMRDKECDTSVEDLPSMGEVNLICIQNIGRQLVQSVISVIQAPCAVDWSRSSVAAIARAALICMGPRIDFQVSEQASHLLRAPMGIHSKTGCLGIFLSNTTLSTFFPIAGKTVPILIGLDGKLQPHDLALKCKKEFIDWVNDQQNLPLSLFFSQKHND